MVSREEYYPFGETSFGSYSKKRYRFCGKEKDEESGLYYYGMRYYSAWTCRFMSVDPLAAKYPFYTPYQYAGNKPINFKDVDGAEDNNNSTGQNGTNPNIVQDKSNPDMSYDLENDVTLINGQPCLACKPPSQLNITTNNVNSGEREGDKMAVADKVYNVTDAAKIPEKVSKTLDQKAADEVTAFRKEGHLKMSDGSIKKTSRFDKEGNPVNFGYKKNGQTVTSKGVDQSTITTPKSESLKSASQTVETAGKVFERAGYLFDIYQIRNMAMGKMGLGEAVTSAISSAATVRGNPAMILAAIAVDLVVEEKVAQFKEVELEVALKSGYEAAKEHFEGAKNSGVVMIYVTNAELEQIVSGKIDNRLQLSDPYNADNPNLNWALLVSDNGKNNNFTVYGGFFLK